MPLKFWAHRILLVAALVAVPAHAGKLDAYIGAYDFAAKTPVAKGSKSGVGAYKVSFLLPISDRFEAGIGYSLIYSDIFTGDSVYGFDVELAYFPFTSAGRVQVASGNTQVAIEPQWRPFAMVGFNPRQFQSISTQYNGYSLALGTERTYTGQFNLKGMVRYAMLTGPNTATASEITILGGISFNF